MNNKIITLSSSELDNTVQKLYENGFFVVELDGKDVKDEEHYVLEMKNKFNISFDFPKPVTGWLNDYLCDLSWISNCKIAIVIRNYDLFLSDYEKKKRDIILDFDEIILPWWEEEVEEHMVGGQRKVFLVYLEQS